MPMTVEDWDKMDRKFERVYDQQDELRIEVKEDREKCATAVNERITHLESEVTEVREDVASNKTDIDWHKWYIRGLAAGTITVAAVAGYTGVA